MNTNIAAAIATVNATATAERTATVAKTAAAPDVVVAIAVAVVVLGVVGVTGVAFDGVVFVDEKITYDMVIVTLTKLAVVTVVSFSANRGIRDIRFRAYSNHIGDHSAV